MALRPPGALNEKMVLFPEITRRGRHDRALADHNFAALFECLPHVFLTYEVGRIDTLGVRSGGGGVDWGLDGAVVLPPSVRLASFLYPRDVRNSSMRRARASAAIPAGTGGCAGRLGNDGTVCAPGAAVGCRTTAGLVSYARRLMFSRCIGEILSDVMLPP